MNADTFLRRAKNEISDNPRQRLTLLAKTMIDQPDCVIDVHTHIFDKKCLSIHYILLRMAKSKILDSLGFESYTSLESTDEVKFLNKNEEEIYKQIEKNEIDSEEDWAYFEKELENVVEFQEEYELFGVKLKDAFKVLGKDNMLEVLDFYINDLSIINIPKYSNHKLVTGILQMDLETGWDMKIKRDFKQQIEDIKEITKKRPVLPFLAIDPRRTEVENPDYNLYDIFLDVFSNKTTPFFGIKCYPALGYLPSDKRLEPIFEICAEKNIPVLTHCGGESVATFKKTIKVKGENGYKDFKIPGKNLKERARFLNNPSQWDSVLNKHPNLKLNFGHFGGNTAWERFIEEGSDNVIQTLYSMMNNPDWRVYSDFSYDIIKDELHEKFKEELDNNPGIANKTLYGTDYWVVLPAGDLLKQQKDFLDLLSNHSDNLLYKNVLDYLLN